jgi:hypothetical protein
MKFNCDFSYRHYLEVLNFAKNTHKIGPIQDYLSLKKNKRFILLRHDVDFSLKYALDLAKIEAKNNITSTYFVLFNNPFYNVFSEENISYIKKINELGHEIGLHYDSIFINKKQNQILKAECELLEKISGKKIKSIAPHNVATNKKNKFSSKNFFDAFNIGTKSEIEYISDSVRNWRKGCMCNHIMKNKLQILTHPMWWNKKNLIRNQVYDKFEKDLQLEVNQEISKLKKYHKSYFKIIEKS